MLSGRRTCRPGPNPSVNAYGGVGFRWMLAELRRAMRALQQKPRKYRNTKIGKIGKIKQIGKITFPIIKEWVDEVVTVTVDEICAAVEDIFQETRSISEPAGALSLAGLKKLTKNKGCK